MTANIKGMEMHLRNAVASALAAQQRLSRARRAAGLRDRPAIYTAAEVREMRVEWYAEWRKMMIGLMNAPHNPTYKRVAELAIRAHNNARMAQSAKDKADQIVEAAAKARAGGPELKPTGLAADILATGAKRRGLPS